MEILLEREHAVEPTFGGKVFVSVMNTDRTEPTAIEVRRSAGRDYGASVVRGDMAFVARDRWLAMRSPGDLDLVRADSRSHRFFPMDSAAFDTELTVAPILPVRLVRVTNRVPGFVLDCASLSVSWLPGGPVRVRFELDRSPLVRLVALFLLAAALALIVPIARLQDDRAFATAVASYFFSLWSVRSVFASQVLAFPTILDLTVLTLCAAMIGGLVLRMLVLSRGDGGGPFAP